MRQSIMVEPARLSPIPTLENASGIIREREQLLFHAEQIRDYMHRTNTDNDEHSTRCQICGRGNTKMIPQQKCANILDRSLNNYDADSSRYGKIDSFSPWFPETDPKHPRAQTWIKKLSHRGTALFLQIVISTTALMFNISVTVYATAKYGMSSGFGDIYQGDCRMVTKYNILLHVGINVCRLYF